jgi:hypothetical protein
MAITDSSSNVIHGCYLTKVGLLRVIDPATQHCLPAETAIEWNQTGPPGPKGDPGIVSSLDALNGVPCTRFSLAGTTAVLNPVAEPILNMNVACVTKDISEPNDTRASETTIAAMGGPVGTRTLYPAGDEDWFVVTGFSPGAPVASVSVTQQTTGADSSFNAPIHIEIYLGGALVASGDTNLKFTNPNPTTGQTIELHVSGPGPAAYTVGG